MIRAKARARKIVAKRGATGDRAKAIKKRAIARIKKRKGPLTSGMMGSTQGGPTGPKAPARKKRPAVRTRRSSTARGR